MAASPRAVRTAKKPRTAVRKTPVRTAVAVPRARKISVTVDENVLAEVEEDARRAHRTLSAYITEALARDLRRRRLDALIQDYETEHGEISDDELARVRAQWRD